MKHMQNIIHSINQSTRQQILTLKMRSTENKKNKKKHTSAKHESRGAASTRAEQQARCKHESTEMARRANKGDSELDVQTEAASYWNFLFEALNQKKKPRPNKGEAEAANWGFGEWRACELWKELQIWDLGVKGDAQNDVVWRINFF